MNSIYPAEPRVRRYAARHRRPLSCGLERLEHRLFLSVEPNWAVAIGGPGDDNPRALAVDAGYVYTAVDIDPAPDSDFSEVTLVKYDPAGGELDRTVIAQSGTGQMLRVTGLAVGSNGDLIVAGTFIGNHDLDPAAPGGELVGSDAGSGFVAKFTAKLEFQWSETLASVEPDTLTAIDVVGSSIYLIGRTALEYTQASLAFGDETVLDYSAGIGELPGFLVKVEDTLQGPVAVWARQIQESGSVFPSNVLVDVSDSTEEVYITGQFGVSRKAVIGGQVMSTDNNEDAFIVKFEATNNQPPTITWAHQIAKSAKKNERNGRSSADALARGVDGAIYVGGRFTGSRDFGDQVLTPLSRDEDFFASDGYLLRIDEDVAGAAEVTWTRQIGSYGALYVNSMGIFGDTSLYVAGSFDGTADFDPSGNVEERASSEGSRDLFLLELGASAGNYLRVQQAGAAGAETLADLAVGDVVHVLGRSDSPLVPTMSGTLETAGMHDGILIHVNPAAPQLAIDPVDTLLVQAPTQTFTATAFDRSDGDLSSQVDWVLDNAYVQVDDSAQLVLTEPLSLGPHELTMSVTNSLGIAATYRHAFDITLAVPTGLMADVVRNGKTSDIYLSWDAVPGAEGYYLEFNNRLLTSGWELRYQGPETTFLHCIDKRVGTAAYRVRAYTTLPSGEEIVSPYSTVLEVDPAVGGTVMAPVEQSLVSFAEIAAAVDQVFGEDES